MRETMLHICKPNGKIIRSFKNDDAFNHLSAGELLEDHPDVDTTHWSFVIFPAERVPNLYFNLKQKPVPAPLKEAYEQQLGVIEICKGDYENPIWAPLVPGLDIGKLKRGWYLEFCKKHGYALVECTSHADFKGAGGEHDQVT
jgi:hypothetical protein